MIRLLSYFLPFLVSSFWAVIYLLRKKDQRHRLAAILLVLASAYYFAYAYYVSPSAHYKSIAILDIVTQPFALSLWALNIAFVYETFKNVAISRSTLLVLLFPVLIQMTAVWVIYSLTGIENAARFFHYWDVISASGAQGADLWARIPEEFNNEIYHLLIIISRKMFNVFSFCYFISLLFFSAFALIRRSTKLSDVFSYLFLGKEVDVPVLTLFLEILLTLCMSPVILYGRTFLFLRPNFGFVLSILLSIVLFLLSYITYSQGPFAFPTINQNLVSGDEHETSESKQTSIAAISPTDALLERLKNALEVERIFLDPMLSLERLADILHTNRTTLSNLINSHYSKSYKNLIAEFRIEESKSYMLENPLATLDEVASHAGFNTSASFYHRFKEATGDPPRVWLSKQA